MCPKRVLNGGAGKLHVKNHTDKWVGLGGKSLKVFRSVIFSYSFMLFLAIIIIIIIIITIIIIIIIIIEFL